MERLVKILVILGTSIFDVMAKLDFLRSWRQRSDVFIERILLLPAGKRNGSDRQAGKAGFQIVREPEFGAIRSAGKRWLIALH
nr:hypothetical protein [uncultured Cohaesibacter sp.]